MEKEEAANADTIEEKIVSKAKSWFEYVALALLAAWLAFFLGWS